PGQALQAGAPLGIMPSVGKSPQELYFEVRTTDGPIDPARLMGQGRGAERDVAGLRPRLQGVE
ncbi:MAG: hypothetical protein ACREEW_01650, partial [Caulobacteraceae bacterium]